MQSIIQTTMIILDKLPFFIEFIYNGLYIFLYSATDFKQSFPSLPEEILSFFFEFQKNTIPLVFFLQVIFNYLREQSIEHFMRFYMLDLIIFLASISMWGDADFMFWLSLVHFPYLIISNYRHKFGLASVRKIQFVRIPSFFKLRPAQLLLLTFTLPIIIGSFFLMLPISSTGPYGISFINALFMSTSAVCVTGLSTISVGGDLTFFGQIVMLLLIQVGGLGMMILYASLTLLLGRSMAIKERIVIQDILDISSLEDLLRTIMDIIKYTFIIELWGTIILTMAFIFEGHDFGMAFYYGLFHAISAFCNAGISLFQNSFENYATNPLVQGVIAILVTLGGIGFVVLKELKGIFSGKRNFSRLTFHTKIVLLSSLSLVVAAWAVIFFGEYMHALSNYSLWEKLQISLFQAITLRTAGFDTIPFTSFHPHLIYLLTIFMFIGASPGSTGGGIKTTTFAILLRSIFSTIRGREQVDIFNRRVPNIIVVKATALTIISMLITTFFIFLLMKFEQDTPFLSLLFECVSAIGTVGISLDVTSNLTEIGKAIVMVLMFIGRVGPLTTVLAIGHRAPMDGNFDFPEGKVVVG